MNTSNCERKLPKKLGVPKHILSQKYKNLIQRGGRKKSIEMKKIKTKFYNNQSTGNENIPNNSSLIISHHNQKKGRNSNSTKSRKKQRPFTGKILNNVINRTISHNNDYRGKSSDNLIIESKGKENLRSASNQSLTEFQKNKENKKTVEKILKNLQKKNKLSFREEVSKKLTKNKIKKNSYSYRLRKSFSLTGSQNLFNEHFANKKENKESLTRKSSKREKENSQLKSSSMSQLCSKNNPQPVLNSKDSEKNPPDSKRTPLDNYFKIYLTQCKSIKFTSPENENEEKNSLTAVEHNSQNSEFIQNLKKFLTTERENLNEKTHEKIEETNDVVVLSQEMDVIQDEEEVQVKDNIDNEITLKTRRKFDMDSEDKSPPLYKRDGSSSRFEFSAKVLGNMDHRRRQKFFDKENGMNFLKKWRLSKHNRELSKEILKEKKEETIENLPRVRAHCRKKSGSNFQKKEVSKKKRKNMFDNKKIYGSFRNIRSREGSFDSLHRSGTKHKRNRSVKSTNSRRSGSLNRNKKIIIRKFDSSVMSNEIKELTLELKKLKFTKEKISEFNEIFLPYLDFTFNLEIENGRLKTELKESKDLIKELGDNIKNIQLEHIENLKTCENHYREKLDLEKNLRKNFEKNLEETEISLNELKKQNEILNDVLKGFCQERTGNTSEEQFSIDANSSYKLELITDPNVKENEEEVRGRRRESVRRSQDFKSRKSSLIPKNDVEDEILKLKYQLKIANEEIHDFKNSLKVEKECQLFKIKQFVHTLKKYKEGGSIKLKDYIDRSFKIYYDNASPDNFEELTEKAKSFIESKEQLIELRRDNHLKGKEIQFLREENIKMLKILETYEAKLEEVARELKHYQDKLEATGSLSYRDMSELYKTQKINYKDSPDLILEVDESVSDYCGNDSTGKKNTQNVYDEDQVRIHSEYITHGDENSHGMQF